MEYAEGKIKLLKLRKYCPMTKKTKKEKPPTYERSSRHSTKFANKNKLHKLSKFILEYQKVVQYYIDLLWNNLKEDMKSPRFVSTKDTQCKTNLYGRAIKCAATQAAGIVRSVTEKYRKKLYIKELLIKEGKDYNKIQSWLDNHKATKPVASPECHLNSICSNIKESKNFYFVQLNSLGKEFGDINLPIKFHKQSNKWKGKGKLLNGIIVKQDTIQLCWEMLKKVKTEGTIEGADQGKLTCLTLSDQQFTPKNKQGQDLSFIMDKLARRKKGSKGFKRAQEHRFNYINWSINQLNLTNIKQINLEEVINIPKLSRLMTHWCNPLIRDKVLMTCEEREVLAKLQSCAFRSQRCSHCGLVLKANRRGKIYCCSGCGHNDDADFNASCNHKAELPDVPEFLRRSGFNKTGFYWLENGFFDMNGNEITERYTNKN